jgi:hypothetical protein
VDSFGGRHGGTGDRGQQQAGRQDGPARRQPLDDAQPAFTNTSPSV